MDWYRLILDGPSNGENGISMEKFLSTSNFLPSDIPWATWLCDIPVQSSIVQVVNRIQPAIGMKIDAFKSQKVTPVYTTEKYGETTRCRYYKFGQIRLMYAVEQPLDRVLISQSAGTASAAKNLLQRRLPNIGLVRLVQSNPMPASSMPRTVSADVSSLTGCEQTNECGTLAEASRAIDNMSLQDFRSFVRRCLLEGVVTAHDILREPPSTSICSSDRSAPQNSCMRPTPASRLPSPPAKSRKRPRSASQSSNSDEEEDGPGEHEDDSESEKENGEGAKDDSQETDCLIVDVPRRERQSKGPTWRQAQLKKRVQCTEQRPIVHLDGQDLPGSVSDKDAAAHRQMKEHKNVQHPHTSDDSGTAADSDTALASIETREGAPPNPNPAVTAGRDSVSSASSSRPPLSTSRRGRRQQRQRQSQPQPELEAQPQSRLKRLGLRSQQRRDGGTAVE